jgi:hypothetical protein
MAGQRVAEAEAKQGAKRLSTARLLEEFAEDASAFIGGVVEHGANSFALRRRGTRALAYIMRLRAMQPTSGDSLLVDLKNLIVLSQLTMQPWLTLRFTRELLEARACADDAACFCTTASAAVTRIRVDERNHSEAARFFAERVRRRCGYTSSFQMPAPHTEFDPVLRAQPFWDLGETALGRLMLANRGDLIRELQPFVASAPWRKDADVPYELIEAGSWRQLSLFESRTGWSEAVCTQIPVTCGLLRSFQRSPAGDRELGNKVKLFELGAHSSLLPHCGVTNKRIFLHMAIGVPERGGSYLRVGSERPVRWTTPGQLVLFDDSFEHSVWNEANEPRHVLGIEIVHPDVTT